LNSSEYKVLVKHTGGCHCGAVRFELRASADLHLLHCNCSTCTKKQIKGFFVPASQFRLLIGADNLTVYTFNMKQAKHTFCKICGVQSFYTPRSHPNGYVVMAYCLDEGTVNSVTVEQFNGKDWEKSMKENKALQNLPK
ncbi:centromere protein V, partial [Carcharodon carcharias]|uniref:centromere protein V n=1 Tax=Carcharodon carcharias TaxID=13397 RepID=UPI001B7EB214